MRVSCLLVVALAMSCSTPVVREICNNGKDDDSNGLTDCADLDCAGQSGCDTDAGYYGSCGKCGNSCTSQSQCFGNNVLDDRPIAQCGMGKCRLYNRAVQVRIEYNTAGWGGIQPNVLGAITTRWISKTALDGSAVTCSIVTAASTLPDGGTTQLQLETSGRFALLGFDTTKVQVGGGSIPNPLTIPYAYVGVGSDYLIFSEAYSGGTDSSTHLPNGTRRSTSCVESGAEIAPLTVEQDCFGDGGVTTCRTLRLTLNAP